MPDFSIRVCLFVLENDEVVADYRHRRRIVRSKVDGCCSARVPHADRVDREDSAAARLVQRIFLKSFSRLKWSI